MARTPSQTIAPPDDRSTRDALVMVGIGIILLFAALGVVSAGIFLGNKVTGNSKPGHAASTSTGRVQAMQDVHRAQAQATQIVQAAQTTGKSIVKHSTTRANRQAAAIVAAAKHKASQTSAGTTTGAVAAAPTAAPSYSYPSTSSGSSSAASGSTSSGGVASGSSGSTGSADLSNLPASWLVVGYNATFGSGPGSVGGITVLNRGNKTFHGVARVIYAKGGQATAAFSGLAPGQSAILPLNGPAYPGGGYRIEVDVP